MSAAMASDGGGCPLPVVDVSPWYRDSTEDSRRSLVAAVRAACETTGFLVVTGIPGDLSAAIARAEGAARALFQGRTAETIESCLASEHGDGAYGYFPQQTEALGYSAEVSRRPDLREAFSMGPIEGVRSARLRQKVENSRSLGGEDADFFRRVVDFCYQPTPWPSSKGGAPGSEDFRAAMEEFYRLSSALGSVLLEVMALALGFDQEHFSVPSSEGENCNSARAIWYPRLSQPAAEGQMRCGPHSDTGALTLLWCDGPGLEVQMGVPGGGDGGANAVIQNNLSMMASDAQREATGPAPGAQGGAGDGEPQWTPVYPRSAGMQERRSLIVNIGDLLQKASGDRWKSTPHRVRAPEIEQEGNQDRLVLVQFVMLAADFPMGGTTQGEYSFGHFKRWGRNRS